MKKELAELQEELAKAHQQVHISEARVSTALDKLAHMEELVNDRLLLARNATESDKPSTPTSVQDLDREKTNIGAKSLNVSGPVQPYSPNLKNFWYPVAFTADLKHDTMVCICLIRLLSSLIYKPVKKNSIVNVLKVPIDCFEQPWVIFRGEDGKPGCVRNTCAHRACPLDLGTVKEGRI